MRMKALALALLAAAAFAPGDAFAQRGPRGAQTSARQSGPAIERGADIRNREALPAAIALVRARGYRCDSVSAFWAMAMARGYSLRCNGFAYTYRLRDRGGRWAVELG